jgi:hypothetical protein
MTLDIEVYLACNAHGVQKWDGHLFCLGCGRLYEYDSVPKTCPCGVEFLLDGDGLMDALRLTSNLTDKRIKRMCRKCFKYFKKKGGRVPVETRKPS